MKSVTVEIEKDDKAHPSEPLVSIRKRTVLGNAMAQHRRLHQERWIEVDVTEARLRGMKG